MKRFFAYIRVSTPRQGRGVSLQEQRSAITLFAERNGIEIIRWFDELETASKRGRPIFNEMLRLLRRSKADGVLIHNIDRSMRNLSDWTELVESLPEHIEISFVNEGLDIRSTTGRLAADVKAAVSAHYSRNLREEAKKGFYGRLKQGIYPMRAPLGYLDRGAGRPKEIDPVRGPLIRHAFELYSTGRYTLEALLAELYRLGLRNRLNGLVSLQAFAVLLRNPFYISLIKIKKTGETFAGAHEPLISTALFENVQARLDGRANRWRERNAFLFRRLWKCRYCQRSLAASLHKGRIYYRCQTTSCPTICYREDALEQVVAASLRPCEFNREERAAVAHRLDGLAAMWRKEAASRTEGIRLRLGQVEARLERLTDALIDGLIDKESCERRRASLLLERRELQEALADVTANPESIGQKTREILELAGSLYSQYELASDEKKRQLLLDVTSNRIVDEEKVELTLRVPFVTVASRNISPHGGASRRKSRTLEDLIQKIVDFFRTEGVATANGQPTPSPGITPLLSYRTKPAPDAKAADLAA